IVPSPNQGTSANWLYGVSAVSSNDVWAVGYYGNGNPYYTLTEHWNGSAWSIVPSPSPGQADNRLYGVAAVSANDVWAVGWCSGCGAELTHPVSLHWNGATWSEVPMPDRGGIYNELQGVVAVSANDVWAVGWNYPNAGGGYSLIEHYPAP